MENRVNKCPGCKRISCNGCGIFQKLNTNKQIRVQFPEGFAADLGEGLGISFDVGTTTLAGMLWDLKEGSLLDAETGANPQAAFGADVISRIQAAMESVDKLEKMQELVLRKLDEMAAGMMGRISEQEYTENISKKKVQKVTIVGNTAMCEILMGIRPEGLFRAPFMPDYKETFYRKGEQLGFQFLKDTDVIILPPIGGYVGADALAVNSYVNWKAQRDKVLAVDIGTNGEILLLCGEKRYACSAAAGPALEGGAVSQGMRAAAGAVDMVSISGRFPMQDIVCRVIGGGNPLGICGSGLVDGLAQLYRIGVLDQTGYMRSAKEAKEAGVPERICKRIETMDDTRRFLLTDKSHPVYILADDVRALQLSVSAIRSGMEILLEKAGIKADELDKIYLAGAFGCYISIESGIAIGLFPDVPREKMVQAGNLAGTGAAMALLSEKVLQSSEEESRRFVHVELADEDSFKERFLEHMNLPFI
ncbi:MAG: ASKHA domain-containing protein [Lachnospiraceae bacterium]|nr:ASKHA domain-containing protein [Lachnospiraceae bacterium]